MNTILFLILSSHFNHKKPRRVNNFIALALHQTHKREATCPLLGDVLSYLYRCGNSGGVVFSHGGCRANL